MMVKYVSIIISSMAFCVSAIAEPQTPSLEELSKLSVAMQSRTCGLVLLSMGREKIREAKTLEKEYSKETTERYAQGFTQLVSASLLLRDGRPLENKEIARKWSRTLAPLGSDKRISTGDFCENWLQSRLASSDFDRSEEAIAESTAMAEMTARTE